MIHLDIPGPFDALLVVKKQDDMQTPHSPSSVTGWWAPGATPPQVEPSALAQAILDVNRATAWVQHESGHLAVGWDGVTCYGGAAPEGVPLYPLLAYVPALHPGMLGAASFRQRHRLQYAYVAGAMANGIASTDIVVAMAQEGMLGMFGAAGLDVGRVAEAIATCKQQAHDRSFGFNLIHSPNETGLEDAVVDLYLREGVKLVSASAYLDLTLPLLRYRLHGIHLDQQGQIVCPNRVMAKVSRREVAKHFLSPAPEKLLRALVSRGHLTEQQAQLASRIPVADDMIAEADSGGHTDNQSTLVLLPVLLALRDELQAQYQYTTPIHIGLAGGIATPTSAAAAFAMGADFIVTGSINQACVEAGTSQVVREMLAEAMQADVMMAPAADMFEMGVQVQVLKRGTMFGVRARKIYDLYRSCESLEAIPAAQRKSLERDYFRCSLEEAWAQTEAFFRQRDPSQNERAARDPKHKMALVFRSYLGRASKWANAGEPSRKIDYQIWCGPAMGAFNQWTKGSVLADPAHRHVGVVGLNLMLGASVKMRLHWLSQQGVSLPPSFKQVRPLSREQLKSLL